MSGADALYGYRYQLQITLEYVYSAVAKNDSDWTLEVEAAAERHSEGIDKDIVDFAIEDHGVDERLVAQVKGGRAGATIGVAELARCIFRLVRGGRAGTRVLLTNRAPLEGASSVLRALATSGANVQAIRDALEDALKGSPRQLVTLRHMSDVELHEVARVRVIFDTREDEEVEQSLRVAVKDLRDRFSIGVGWRTSGLVNSLMLDALLKSATQPDPDNARLTSREVRDILSTEARVLQAAILQRDWGRVIGRLPLPGDVPRQEALRLFDAELTKTAGGPVPMLNIVGPSGIGKSSLASAYALEYLDRYSHVFWIDSSNLSSIRAQFSILAKELKVDSSEGTSDLELQQVVHNALGRSLDRWLMVFDNATADSRIRQWVPTFGTGHVVLTTVDRTARGHGAQLELSSMTAAEAESLLRERFVDDPVLSREEQAGPALSVLAEGLEFWPLALELGSRYMIECGLGLADVDQYLRKLRFRSLGDDVSIPFGYTRTLVAAIETSMEMLVGDGRSEADSLGLAVLLQASLLLSRQIPIHLLLQSFLVQPREALESGTNIPLEYDSDNPPIEEIYRSIRRFSLCINDDPLLRLDGSPSARNGLASVSFTINVNEIVQEVLRKISFEREFLAVSVSALAFFLQSWVAYYRERDEDVLELDAHGLHLTQLGIEHDLIDYNVALLCGNLAARMTDRQQFEEAVRLLRAEVDYLDRDSAVSTVWVQSVVSLAFALYGGTDRTDLVASDVIALLGRALPAVSRVQDDQEETLAATVRQARVLLDAPSIRRVGEERVTALSALAEALTQTLPALSDLSPLVVAAEANSLIEAGRYREAEELVLRAMSIEGIARREKAQLDRFLAEALSQQSRWLECVPPLASLEEAVAGGVNDYVTVSNVVLNVGIAALVGFMKGQAGAATVHNYCTLLFARYRAEHGEFRPTDEARRLLLITGMAQASGRQSEALEVFRAVSRNDLANISDTRENRWVELYDSYVEEYGKTSPN